MFTRFFELQTLYCFRPCGPTHDLLFLPSTQNINRASHPAALLESAMPQHRPTSHKDIPSISLLLCRSLGASCCPVSSLGSGGRPAAALLKLQAATCSLLAPVSSGSGAHPDDALLKHPGGPVSRSTLSVWHWITASSVNRVTQRGAN
jgi:hypothetical protein